MTRSRAGTQLSLRNRFSALRHVCRATVPRPSVNMRRLSALVFLASLYLSAAPVGAAVFPTDLDGLDIGTQILSARTSDFMTADLTGQGGPPPHSIGSIVGTVWLKNGMYTYRYVVTPTANG